MDFTKAITEINVSEGEYKDFVKNNINDTEEIEEYLLRIKEDIKFKLFDEKSKFKIEIDELLENSFVYIKNKDVYYCKDLNGLFPNFKTFQFGKSSTSNVFDLDTSDLEFSGYKGASINEKEVRYIYNKWNRYCGTTAINNNSKDNENIEEKLLFENIEMPITYYSINTREYE